MHSFPLVGRVLLSSYFIAMGMSHLIHFRTHAAFIGGKGVPLARAATMLTIVMMLVGGALVLFDWHRWIGGALLFGIIFPALCSCIIFGKKPKHTRGSASSPIL